VDCLSASMRQLIDLWYIFRRYVDSSVSWVTMHLITMLRLQAVRGLVDHLTTDC
jgi:hypothetical protein